MKRTVQVALVVLVLLLAGRAAAVRHHDGVRVAANDAIARASVVVWSAPAETVDASPEAGTADVLTAHDTPSRLGWNPHEVVLTPSGVNGRTFGKRFEVRVDGQVYAQPLVASGVTLPRLGRRNVLVIATENDSVYALDADTGATLWHHTFAGCCGVTAAPASALNGAACRTVGPIVGISSTPAIDRARGTVYVVAKTMTTHDDAATFHNTLHALSLASGEDRMPPEDITAHVDLSWRGAFARGHSLRHGMKRLLLGGGLRFDPRIQFNRPGLLLANGSLYVGFSSHCDAPDAHGWVFAYDAATLAPQSAFVTVGDWNDVNGGGVWQSGFGLTGDSSGNVYFTTGNGPFDADRGGRDFGNSLVKMTAHLGRVAGYYTPFTQAELETNDADFGGGGVVALPDRRGRYGRLAVATSKLRAIFLLDRDAPGGYVAGGPDRIVQLLGDVHDETSWCIGTCGGPAYYEGPAGEYVFNVWAMDSLRTYRLDRGGVRPRLIEVAASANTFPGWGGAIPSVSSNGRLPGTAIVWATTRPVIGPGRNDPIELFAYDASNVAHMLYRGNVSPWSNKNGVPFLTPTIANGKVYVGGDGSVSVFALRGAGESAAPRRLAGR